MRIQTRPVSLARAMERGARAGTRRHAGAEERSERQGQFGRPCTYPARPSFCAMVIDGIDNLMLVRAASPITHTDSSCSSFLSLVGLVALLTVAWRRGRRLPVEIQTGLAADECRD